MNRVTLALMLGHLMVLQGACSDDTTTGDAATDGQVISDAYVDRSVEDVAVETAKDQALSDLEVDIASDAAADGVTDATIPDTTSDGAPPDGGLPTVWGYISRSVDPLLDGKGDIYVGLYQPMLMIPLASTAINQVDMSQTTSSIKYEVFNPPPGTYGIFAMLDDNKTATLFPAALPDAGDLVLSVYPEVTVGTSGATQVDLVLDKLQGNGQGLMGKVSASVNPSLDGKGTLNISLHQTPPPSPSQVTIVMRDVDLSSPFASETYIINAVPGNYYLNIFLDDNGSVNPFAPGSDKGDLIHTNMIQAHIVQGKITSRDVVLNQIKP